MIGFAHTIEHYEVECNTFANSSTCHRGQVLLTQPNSPSEKLQLNTVTY